jgi:uncharacterized membrane protein YhaH (DUF805 family)
MAYEPTSLLKILRDIARHTVVDVLDYRARSNRLQMIIGAWLINWASGMLEWAIDLVGNVEGPGSSGTMATKILVGSLSMIFVMPLLVRRLHDFNFRGWWALLALAPVPLSLLATATGTRLPQWGGHSRIIIDVSNLGLLALLFFMGWIAIMATPGTNGPNRFGDPS